LYGGGPEPLRPKLSSVIESWFNMAKCFVCLEEVEPYDGLLPVCKCCAILPLQDKMEKILTRQEAEKLATPRTHQGSEHAPRPSCGTSK
jgi:hypothetical protein